MRTTKIERKQKAFSRISTLYLILMFAFVYLPIIVTIVFSFNNQDSNTYWVGFTTKYYIKLFKDTQMWEVFYNTCVVTFGATLIATLVGTLGAFGLMRYDFRIKGIISNALIIPMVIPEIVLGVALLTVFTGTNFSLGYGTMIIGLATLTMPFVVTTVKSRLADFDSSIEEASLDLGANRKTTFMKITLPMIMPGVMSGAFLAFSLALDDLIIANFVCGNDTMTLPIKIYAKVKSGINPELFALTTLIMVFCLVVYVGYKVIVHKK